MRNGQPPQGGQPPPEGYPQGGKPQYPQQGSPSPQQGQPPPGGAYPEHPQQQSGYGQYPQGPNAYQSGPSGPRANFGQRLLALLLDLLILVVPFFILFALAGGFDELSDDGGQTQVISPTENLLFTLMWLALSWAYFTLLEGSQSGQTIGKKALSIRVVRLETGGSIGYGRALGRTAVRSLPGNIPLIGLLWYLLDGLWMLWDRENQTLHDKATKTLVVPVAAYPIQPQGDVSQQQSYGRQQQGHGPPGTPPPSQPPPGGYNPNP